MGLEGGLLEWHRRSTAFVRKPFASSELNMAFLKSVIWHRIVGHCFFEEFPHRDRRMEFYLENCKNLLRKRTHFCLLEQRERIGLEGKEGRREGRKEGGKKEGGRGRRREGREGNPVSHVLCIPHHLISSR